ncbi:MAG: hypothetical protein AAB353_09460 [Candidatus Hydrogenedentota bacterium]
MATGKKPAPETKKSAVGIATDMVKRAQEGLRSIGGDTARRQTARFAARAIEMQRRIMIGSIDALGRMQDQTGKAMHDALKNTGWVPNEAKQVIEEWRDTGKKGRDDFRKTTDKSFDLVAKYLERVQKTGTAQDAPAKPSTKAKAAKSAPKKAAPKKAPAKS